MNGRETDYLEGTARLPGFEMDYFAFGRGKKPMVIIPGMSILPITASGPAVASAFHDFMDEYRVYVLDYRRDLPKGHTVRDMAADAIAALRSLGIQGAAMMGTSLGGMICQHIAADAPELVGRLALCSTLPRHTKKSLRVFETWVRLARSGDMHALQKDVLARVYSKEYVRAYRQAFAAQEQAYTPSQAERYARLSEACMGFCAYDELKRIHCPVLVVGSWRDRTLYPEGSLLLAKKLRCELMMYAGYSHAVYDEAPDFRKRLKTFLLDV